MRAGIIAAGHGSRISAAHPGVIKPLIPVAGVPLCHWVAASLRRCGIEKITLLHNSRGDAVRESLEKAFPDLAWTFLCRNTASSWESFRLVSQSLARSGEPFVISTVDALVRPAEAARFLEIATTSRAEAGLALTAFVDDEKPLWADVGDDGLVRALGPKAVKKRLVTSGLYYLTPAAAARMPEASAHGSLREYWMTLVENGARVAGVVLSKTIDVDRPQDIPQAEGFLKEAKEPAW